MHKLDWPDGREQPTIPVSTIGKTGEMLSNFRCSGAEPVQSRLEILAKILDNRAVALQCISPSALRRWKERVSVCPAEGGSWDADTAFRILHKGCS